MTEIPEDQLGLIGGVIIVIALLFALVRGAGAIMNVASIALAAAVSLFLYTSGSQYVSEIIGSTEPIAKFIGAAIGGVVAFFFARFFGVLFLARVFKMFFGSKMRKLLPIIVLSLGGCFVKNTISSKNSPESPAEVQESQIKFQSSELLTNTAEKVRKMSENSDLQNKFSLFELRYFFSNLMYEAKGKVLEWTGNGRTEVLIEDQYRYDVIKLTGILTAVDEQAIGLEYQRVVRSAGVQSLLQNRRVVRALVRKDYDSLYRNPQIEAYIKNPQNKALLDAVKW